MIINLKDFLKSPDQNLSFKGQIDNNETDYVLDGLNINFPIIYQGVLTKIGGDNLKVEMDIEYNFDTNCDRCLKPINKVIKSSFVAYSFDDALEYESDEQTFEIENDGFFVDDLVISMIITSSQSKTLCKEDCKGLCPKCGTDWNVESCNCEQDQQVDLRFEELLNLFNDEEV